MGDPRPILPRVWRHVSHGAPIQGIRVHADHTHGGITLSIFGYMESFCMYYCMSRLLHYDIGLFSECGLGFHNVNVTEERTTCT